MGAKDTRQPRVSQVKIGACPDGQLLPPCSPAGSMPCEQPATALLTRCSRTHSAASAVNIPERPEQRKGDRGILLRPDVVATKS